MSKKILILHASARKNGNTAILAAAAKAAAEKAGDTVTLLECTDLKIGPCHDCKSCFKTGRPCTFRDDFDDVVAPALEAANAVVFVAPLYWFETPASLRLVVDKFYAYFVSGRGLGVKSAALVATCGQSNDFVGMVHPYEQCVKLLGWKSAGILTFDQMNEAGAIAKTDAPAKVAALMAKL